MREEQLKKLKRSKDQPQQSLFEAAEEAPQGSLFSTPHAERSLKPEPTGNGKWHIGGMLQIPAELHLVRKRWNAAHGPRVFATREEAQAALDAYHAEAAEAFPVRTGRR